MAQDDRLPLAGGRSGVDYPSIEAKNERSDLLLIGSLERILTLGFGNAKELIGIEPPSLLRLIRKAMSMYVEEKRDGEPLPVAPHEILAQPIQRIYTALAPNRFKDFWRD
jgi:hypothetical protein